MDMNGMTGNGFGSNAMPLGFGMALAMNEPAMQGYASLTEAEKEELLMRCRDVKTKEEMQKIVDSLAPDLDIRAVEEEEKFL